ncbi:DUF4365 domain-containing protein [Dokdonella sp. MW10]|uniref:DUF4365 domain-containing protein n=1 Tax=Dokdonella sp. MW10 TaxID=2992926 RepID=UPI003F7D22BD
MRAPKNDPTAKAGLSEVMADFERIGWGPVPNSSHDLGTDLIIQARDSRRFESGLLVGAQVKAGLTFFEAPAYGEDGELQGWWFYEPTADHFDDWVTHALPHLIVLHDMETRISYWEHVTAERCESTGKGVKILIPASQTVDSEHQNMLFQVSCKQRAASSLERAVFHASANRAPPARRLRYAVLTPRLVALHGNASVTREPEPEETIALIASRRGWQLERLERKFPKNLVAKEGVLPSDWRWRFAHALKQLLDEGLLEPLTDLIAVAPNLSSRCVALAVVAATLFEREQWDEGIALTSQAIDADEAGPVDHAWLLLHRARLRMEVGHTLEAQRDAANALISLQADTDDPTASLLAGVASTIVFVAATFLHGNLEEVINANDTAPSWWRMQVLGWAFGHAFDDDFDNWVGGEPQGFTEEDRAKQHFDSLLLNTSWSADQESWRSVASKAARYGLRTAVASRDPPNVANALDRLRRSGDEPRLRACARFTWAIGPSLGLRDAGSRCALDHLGRTSAKATFTLVTESCDVLNDDDFRRHIEWCLATLRSPAVLEQSVRALGKGFPVVGAAITVLTRSWERLEQRQRARAAELLMHMDDAQTTASYSYAVLASRLGADALGADLIGALHCKAQRNSDRDVRNWLLHALARAGHAESLVALRSASSVGDLTATACLILSDLLLEDAAPGTAAHLEESVSEIIRNARRRSYAFGGQDAAALLFQLGLRWPEHGRWDPLLELVGEPAVAHDHKLNLVRAFAKHADVLTIEQRARLRSCLPALESRLDTTYFTHGAPSARLRLQLALTTEHERESVVATWLSGSRTERGVALATIGEQDLRRLRPALAASIQDSSVVIQEAAARSIGCALALGDPGPDLAHAARAIARGDGCRVPYALIEGFMSKADASAPSPDAFDPLREHPSFIVRTSARDL